MDSKFFGEALVWWWEVVLLSICSPNSSLSSVYKKIIKSNLADNFYIRTHFDHEADTPIGLSFTRGEVFRVVDTMYRGKLGNWLAIRMGNDLHEMDKGTIPNQARSGWEWKQDVGCFHTWINRRWNKRAFPLWLIWTSVNTTVTLWCGTKQPYFQNCPEEVVSTWFHSNLRVVQHNRPSKWNKQPQYVLPEKQATKLAFPVFVWRCTEEHS